MSITSTLRDKNAVIAHQLTDAAQVEQFIHGLRFGLKRALHPVNRGKTIALTISVVVGEDKFGPMVDTFWAASALPCSRAMLSNYIQRVKAKMDPPVYKRVVRPDGRNQRVRLLSLHDLKCLRGAMLSRTPGKQALADRGDIIV
jgi:hypothetical protein